MASSGIESFGSRVAEQRRAQGLTGETLASLTGGEISRSVLANIETGRKSDVTLREAIALSSALNVPLGTLVRESDDFELREFRREIVDRKDSAVAAGIGLVRAQQSLFAYAVAHKIPLDTKILDATLSELLALSAAESAAFGERYAKTPPEGGEEPVAKLDLGFVLAPGVKQNLDGFEPADFEADSEKVSNGERPETT